MKQQFYSQKSDVKQRMITWCQNLLTRDDWLIVDTETTGTDIYAEAIQIGVVGFDGRELYNQLIKPIHSIPSGASDIHGITDETVQNSPLFPDIYQELQQILGNNLLIAYNADFDKRILHQTCRASNLPVFTNVWECAMKRYAEYHGDWNSYRHNFTWQKLETAVKSVGITEDFEYHGALADCFATWKLIERLGNG